MNVELTTENFHQGKHIRNDQLLPARVLFPDVSVFLEYIGFFVRLFCREIVSFATRFVSFGVRDVRHVPARLYFLDVCVFCW